MLKLLSIFLGLVLLAGCAHKPSANDMAEADYGQVPNHYKQMIIAKINESLADPESAKIEVPRPYPAVRYLGISKGGEIRIWPCRSRLGFDQEWTRGSIPKNLPGSTGGVIQVGRPSSHP